MRSMIFNSIIVSKHDYAELIENESFSIDQGLIDCMLHKGNDDYKMYLLAVSQRLYELHRLMYVKSGDASKNESCFYEKILFDNYAEDSEEFEERCKKFVSNKEELINNYRNYELIKLSVSKMLANDTEAIYAAEYAGLIDYIINRKEELPDPEFGGGIFVNNWDNYDPNRNAVTREFIDKLGLH